MRMIVLVMLEEAPDGHRNWTRMSEMKKKMGGNKIEEAHDKSSLNNCKSV